MPHVKFINRFPFWNYVITQIILWLICYAFLVIITHLTTLTISPGLYTHLSLPASLIIALFIGFFNGLSSGIVNQIFERQFFHDRALWIVILLKTAITLFVFIVLLSIVRYSIYPYLARKLFIGGDLASHKESWDYFFYLLLFYNVFAGLVISFINIVHNKFGPGMLVPMLLGKFRSPKEEERIFLFMDLKSSTPLAEHLGHLKYSAFIRDSFMDINAMLPEFNAHVYQYVGDEIVVTWKIKEGLSQLTCIKFFFACQARFAAKRQHYEKNYGLIPNFKAGLHMGKVMAVEVGNIKRDIAYHGDTLNTAARIQSICNEYARNFLLSEEMLIHLDMEEHFDIESLGDVWLKGKSMPIGVASIQAKVS